MRFTPIDRVNERKATEAAVYLVNLRGGKMHHLKLVKLMYLADRKSLLELGSPITADDHVSMTHGPVGKGLLDLIWSVRVGEEETGSDPFVKSFSRPNGVEVELRSDFSTEACELSRAERKILDAIFKEHGDKNRWDLVTETHQLPEWTDPSKSEYDWIPIEHEKILRFEGVDEGEIEEFRAQKQNSEFLQEILA